MQTLALKYRPRILSDLVGQEASVKALTNALNRAQASGRIHHQAFLFAGVRGTGKTSTARILARSLNCLQGPTPAPCGVCDACRASEQPDLNMDVIEIDAASRASVEDARALREQVQTRPAFCRYRVYIIDEVHMLSRSAFDALLKILEEPPAHAVFVLATTELQDVPDTIKSRVQIYPFRLIPAGLIESRLQHVCTCENVGYDDGSLRLLAEAGQGSMRDALTTLDRVIAAGDGQVLESMVREQLGIVPAVRVQNVLEALFKGDAGAVLDECQALASLGSDWVNFWKELMLAFRDRLEVEARKGNPQDILRMARMLQLLLTRERDLREASLPRVVVELALVTASQLPYLVPLDALVKAGGPPQGAPPPHRPKAGTAPRAAVPPATSPAPSPAPAPSRLGRPPQGALPPLPETPTSGLDVSNPADLRRACTESIRRAKGDFPRTLASLPHLATGLELVGGVLRFAFPANVRNTAQDLERERDNPNLLEALRQAIPGLQRLEIAFDAQEGERPEDRLREDPAFQRLLQETGGEIVDVRREDPS